MDPDKMKKSFLQETNMLIEAMEGVISGNPEAPHLDIFLEETKRKLTYDVRDGKLKEFCVSMAGLNPTFRSIPLGYFRIMTEYDYHTIYQNLTGIKNRCFQEAGRREMAITKWKDSEGKTFEIYFLLDLVHFRSNSVKTLMFNHFKCLLSSENTYRFAGISVVGKRDYELF